MTWMDLEMFFFSLKFSCLEIGSDVLSGLTLTLDVI